MSRPSRLVLLLGAAAALLIVLSFPLSALAHQFTFGWLSQAVLMIPFAAVGALVAARQPRNPIGWILLAIAVTAVGGADSGFYAVRDYHVDHGGLPLSRLAVFLTQGWVSMLVLMPLPILLFPEGRVPRRWRWTLWIYAAQASVLLGYLAYQDSASFTQHPLELDASGEVKALGGGGGPGFAVIALTYLAISMSWVIRQVVLYRRSSGDRRQQLKWLMAGGGVAVVGFFLSVSAGSNSHGVLATIGKSGFIGLAALPIGIGVGILRYRLYEIDRLISRTLSYAIVTATLVGVFGGLILLTTRVLPFSSPVGVAASTLAAAALFNPLRRRVQRLVDRRFNRARYDAEETVAAFGARLRNAIEVDAVLDELAEAATRSLEPAHVTVWVRAAP